MKPIHALNLMLALVAAAYGQSIPPVQPTSAVQFYDSTGSTPTSKFGWQGNAATGKFYIETPNGGSEFSLQGGNATVKGTVTATSFVGNGSGLTGIKATGASAGEVATTLKADATFLASVKGTAGAVGPVGPTGPAGLGKIPVKVCSAGLICNEINAAVAISNSGSDGLVVVTQYDKAGEQMAAASFELNDRPEASSSLAYRDINGRYYAAVFNGETTVRGVFNADKGCVGCSQATSDRSLKKDIKVLDSAGEKLKKIEGVSFRWNEKGPKDPNVQFGVIAQNVQQVLPDAVRKRENGELYVDYNAMTALLIEAVNEQAKTIESQQRQIDELIKLLRK